MLEIYINLIPESLQAELSFVLLFIGACWSVYFFIYESTVLPKERNLLKELCLAFVASTFLGFGSFLFTSGLNNWIH